MKLFKNKNNKQAFLSVLVFVVIIALYIELNILISKLNIPDIDVTESKIYTVTDESKNKIANINKDISIKLVNFENYKDYTYVNDVLILIGQYEKINSKIKSEVYVPNESEDIVSQYPYIIVSSGENGRIVFLDSLFFYRYNTINKYEEEYYTSEELITNAILNVASETNDKVYFYLEKSVYNNTMLASMINRANGLGLDADILNLSENTSVPNDCKCLIITPLAIRSETGEIQYCDISDTERDTIISYIENGGNIMFLQESKSMIETETPNLDYIMSLYGFSISDGVIIEKEHMLADNPGCIYAKINTNNNILSNLSDEARLCMFDAGTINLESDEQLKKLNVSYQVLASAGDTSYLRKDITNSSRAISDTDEEAKGAILGLCAEKNVGDNIVSKAIVYSNSLFAINSPIYLKDPITNKNLGVEMVLLDDNEEVMSSSIKYLTDNGDRVLKRKKHYDLVPSTGIITDGITLKVIFVIPMIIIFIGYIVWKHRKNKK